MLIPIAFFGLMAYLVASLVVGVRLLVSAKRTRQLADLVMGVAYLAGGGLGWAVFLISQAPAVQASPVGPILERTSLVFLVVGSLASALATWKLFRPTRKWAALLFYALTALMACEVIHNALLVGPAFPRANDAWYWPGAVARSVTFAWLPLEAFRYRSMLARRLRLGLAEPRVVDQMLLWAMASLTSFISNAVAVTASTLGVERRYGIALVVVWAADGLLGAIALWLAFFPPSAYVRWVERRSPASDGSAGG